MQGQKAGLNGRTAALQAEHESERSRLIREASGMQDQVAALSDTMAALREEHEAERSRLNQEASGLQDQVAALSDTMEALQGQHEQTTRELQSKSAVLNQIYNSHGWKALSIYYNLREGLFPEGTSRRAAAKDAFRLALRRRTGLSRPADPAPHGATLQNQTREGRAGGEALRSFRAAPLAI